jgi:hypothetical protein
LNDLLAEQARLEEDGALEAAEQELGSQIRRLRQQINEASEQAARTLDRR